MLEKLPLFGKRKPAQIPKHLAITVEDDMPDRELPAGYFRSRDKKLMGLLRLQVKQRIPVMTVLLLSSESISPVEVEPLVGFFSGLKDNLLIHNNQVRVSVLGKWYDLPGILVEEVKAVINETKDYDRYFLNLCLNYSGHMEIVDACRLILRKIAAGKLSVDELTPDVIKENLYSSYFLPPDLLIKTGRKKAWPGLLLWDCPGAVYYHAGKNFVDLSEQDLLRALSSFSG